VTEGVICVAVALSVAPLFRVAMVLRGDAELLGRDRICAWPALAVLTAATCWTGLTCLVATPATTNGAAASVTPAPTAAALAAMP